MTQVNIDLLPDAVLLLDDDNSLVVINEAGCELLRVVPSEVTGRIVGEAFDVRTADGTPALRDAEPPSSGPLDLLFRRADGDDVVVSTLARSVDGTRALTLRPSGERNAIAIVSTVAHELRSPLTSVKGYTSLMLDRWERLDDDKKRTMLEQVRHDADRVTRLVTELLDISRLETGQLVLSRRMIDLPELATSVVDGVKVVVPELECSVEFPTGFPAVYADPDKVEQVLTNLVENAAKYANPKNMRIRGEVLDGMVAVSVQDQGEGIPGSDLTHVFTKFFRRDHGRPTGTGLGLWISRGLVEAHGGALSVESVPGEGSTFRFTLRSDGFEREMEHVRGEPESIGDAPA